MFFEKFRDLSSSGYVGVLVVQEQHRPVGILLGTVPGEFNVSIFPRNNPGRGDLVSMLAVAKGLAFFRIDYEMLGQSFGSVLAVVGVHWGSSGSLNFGKLFLVSRPSIN
jgi:hypothetical protein